MVTASARPSDDARIVVKHANSVRRHNQVPSSGFCGGAAAFILWVMALQRTTPTLVANTMTVNPIAAGLLATQLVGAPMTVNLVAGLIAVFVGIWVATTGAKFKSKPILKV
jgi:hypothetical protein